MNWYTLAAIFIVVWWLVLFVTLPIGVRTQDEEGTTVPGSAGSAPARPMLVRKALITTVIAIVIVTAIYIAYTRLGVDLEWLSDLTG
jgi:predicted secreted protein